MLVLRLASIAILIILFNISLEAAVIVGLVQRVHPRLSALICNPLFLLFNVFVTHLFNNESLATPVRNPKKIGSSNSREVGEFD